MKRAFRRLPVRCSMGLSVENFNGERAGDVTIIFHLRCLRAAIPLLAGVKASRLKDKGDSMKVMLTFLPLLLLSGIIFLLIKTLKRTRPADTPTAPGDRKLISTSSFMLRTFGSSQSYKADYYFDTENFYEVTTGTTVSVPLTNIVEVQRESTQINNRSVWSVTWDINGQRKQVRFLHNFTLFNRSFVAFLTAVKQANPSAHVRSLTLFSL